MSIKRFPSNKHSGFCYTTKPNGNIYCYVCKEDVHETKDWNGSVVNSHSESEAHEQAWQVFRLSQEGLF